MSKEGIVIALARDIEFDDFDTLHQLLVNAFAYMEERIDPPSSLHRLSPAGLREKAADEWLVLALQGHELVGCLFARETDDAVYIGKVAVRESVRAQGIGAKLLERAEELALQHAYSWLELEVRVELTENHRFFESHGFVRCGENAHQGYTRPTSFTFHKRIQ